MLNVGKTLYGFTVKRVRELCEIDATLIEMEHASGAELAFLERADSNKSFGISFKTLPEDDTGVFHILEHSVLCGSEKFPLKEPFVDLLKGSLKTFLNAMTYNDKTVYPVASRNDRDFYNLVDVYMDAVLHPTALTDERVFRQEGWHYELSEGGELSYNGVVYNEMKGAYSSADGVAEEAIMQMLFEGSPYAKDSGGCPDAIPELTFEGFRAAHARFYNPSNAQIFLDGEVKLDEILPLLDSYLAPYPNNKREIVFDLPECKDGQRREAEYEISQSEDEEGKCRVYLAGRTCSFSELDKTLALVTLATALAGSNEAPLKQALLNSGLCEDVTLHINDGLFYGYYELEIYNVKRENVDAIIDVAKKTLTKVYKNGIDKKRLAALFNSAEFRHRERDFGSMPKGIIFGLSMLDTWLWGEDPAAPLVMADSFASLRAKIDEGYFEELIREVFIDREPCILTLIPSKTLGERRTAELKAHLAKIRSRMSDDELSGIARAERDLKEWQSREDTPEAQATLPSLSVADIDPTAEKIPTEEYSILGYKAYSFAIPTSAITYLELLFDVSELSRDELALLPTLCALYKNLSTERYSAGELRNMILSELGGLSVNPISLPTPDGAPHAYVCVSASALDEKRPEIISLTKELLFSSILDDKTELRRAVTQGKLSAEDAMISAGHAQALSRAAAYTSASAAIDEILSGYEQYSFINELDKILAEKADDVIKSLKALADKIFRRERLFAYATSSSHDRAFLEEVISSIPDGGEPAGECVISPFGRLNEGIAIPSQVSFAVCAADVIAGERARGYYQVARSIVSYAYLWNSVRVLGGAYGAGLVTRRGGLLGFYSYRDPSPRRSIDCYAEAGKFLRDFVESGEPLERFIIGAYGDYDTLSTPRSAGAKEGLNVLRGWSRETESEFRRELLCTSADDLLKAADRLDELAKNPGVCVIGPKTALDSCSDLLKNRLSLG